MRNPRGGRRGLALSVALALAPAAAVRGQEPPEAPPAESAAADPPGVVLVLGGEGAYGLADLGVLAALEEMRIPVDAVVGSGTGALVGGLYAVGHEPSGMRGSLSDIDWDEAILDRTPRKHLTYRRKVDDRDFLLDLSLGLQGGGIALPRSVFAAERWTLFVQSMAMPAIGTASFDDLPIPFRAVATDLETGKAVVLSHGQLANALRAASALPGLLPPVELEGRLLTDGSLSNALPVDVAQAMGARVVIAVDLDPPEAGKEALRSYLDIGEQVLRLREKDTRSREIEELRPQDVHVHVVLTERSILSHASALAIAEEGRRATLAHRGALAHLALDGAAWQAHLEARRARRKPWPVLTGVRVEGSGTVAPEIVRSRIESPVGEPVDPGALDEDFARVFGLDLFDDVGFRLEGTAEEAELVVDARPKSTGPWSLRFGASSQADISGGNGIDLAGLLVRRPIGEYGAEWRTRVALGTRVLLGTEYIQPLGYGSRFFLAPRAGVDRERIAITQGNDTPAEFDVTTIETGFDLGYWLGDWGELRAGLFHQSGSADLAVGDPNQFQDSDFDLGGLEVGLAHDTLDSTAFPRSGSIGSVSILTTLDALGGLESVELLQFRHDTAFSFGAETVVLGAELDTTLQDDASVENQYPLGGFLRLSGFAPNEIAGAHALLVRALGYHHFGFREGARAPVSFYLGGSIEAGNVFADRDDIAADELLLAGSVFAGLDSFFGPMFLGAGFAETGESNVFLILGSIF